MGEESRMLFWGRGVLFCELLNIIPRRGVVADVECSGESIEAVPNGNVEGLTEDAVSFVCSLDKTPSPFCKRPTSVPRTQ